MFFLYGPLAQLVEQFPFKEWVDGSSPSGLTNNLNQTFIGGYSIITLLIQAFRFSILFLLEG